MYSSFHKIAKSSLASVPQLPQNFFITQDPTTKKLYLDDHLMTATTDRTKRTETRGSAYSDINDNRVKGVLNRVRDIALRNI